MPEDIIAHVRDARVCGVHGIAPLRRLIEHGGDVVLLVDVAPVEARLKEEQMQ